MTRAAGGRCAWPAIWWCVCVAAALPFLLVKHPPFADLPEHVAATSVLARMLEGHAAGMPYVLSLGTSQYFVTHGIGALLAIVLGDAILAHRVLLAFIALGWPVAFRSLLRAMGRDERLAFFAPMLFFDRALLMGFVPFLASVPIGLWFFAAVVRLLRRRRARDVVYVGLLAVALFYTHVSSYVLFVAVSAAWAIARLSRGSIADGRAFLARFSLALAPSACAALRWLLAGGLAENRALASITSRMSIEDTMLAMPIWCFDLWRSHLDEVCAGVWWLAFGALAADRLVAKKNLSLVALAPFGCAAAIYFLTPFHVGVATMLNVRLAPMLALLAILALTTAARRSVRASALVAVSLATVVNGAWSLHEMRASEDEMLGAHFDEVIATMRPGSRLVTLLFDMKSQRTQYWPYALAGSYHVAASGGVAAYSFAELPHWSIRYKEGVAPRSPHDFWLFDPCSYRYVEDGARYDYALVEATSRNPFAHAAGDPFVAVARSGRFTLYEHAFGPPADISESGPCARTD